MRIGATTVVCGVRAEILPVGEIPSFRVNTTKVENKDEDEGAYSPIPLYHLVVPNLELATGCSPRHPANTAPSVEAQSISQRLLSLLHSSRLVRTSDLEIIYTPPEAELDPDPELGVDTDPQLKAYWTLYVDMVCISHGGSVFDAAWLALYAALRDTVLPRAWWDADLGQVVCSPELKETKKVQLRGMPVPSSFGAFVPEKRLMVDEGRSWILMDMDAFEEDVCTETGAITVDVEGDGTEKDALSILRVEKNGGCSIGVDQMMEITTHARRRWYQWKGVLDNAVMTS